MPLHHVHVTFNSSLSTAERKGLLLDRPRCEKKILRVERALEVRASP
jgi:hypothetical protein